jgi:hypothetical protein
MQTRTLAVNRAASVTSSRQQVYLTLWTPGTMQTATLTHMLGEQKESTTFGTERVRQHCVSSGILPFGYGYSSDHRATFIRLEVGKVLSMTIHPSESSATRRLMSATPNERVKFIIELDIHYLSQNLYNRIQKLLETPHREWSDQHTNEFNKCDEQHIMGMLAAEKKTCKIKLSKWSPKFSKAAVEDKAFWKIALSLRRSYIRPNSKFISWATSRGIDDIHEIDEKTLLKYLRESQKTLLTNQTKCNPATRRASEISRQHDTRRKQ